MEEIRFERFTLLIEGIHKSINKLKLMNVPSLGIKSVHVFWLYQLSRHPEGMSAAELAIASMIDRSLVSREIKALKGGGYISVAKGRRYVLTDSGKELAVRISEIVKEIQREADIGITEAELESFYSTLMKLNDNFNTIIEKYQ